ncbi:MAG: hybrid sensor histidine kinase/response regulator [Planctomycetota bacterium]
MLFSLLQVTGIDCGAVYLQDEETRGLRLACSRGFRAPQAGLPTHHEPETERVGPFFGPEASHVFPETIRLEEGLRAFAAIPSAYEGKVVATLNLASRTLDEIPDGSRVLLESAAAQLGGAIGRIRAEAALRESEARHRAISEITSDYAYSFAVDRDGELSFEWVTGALERIRGFTEEELAARGGWESLLHPDDLSVAYGQLESLLAGEEAVVDYRIITKSGAIRWMRDIARPERDPEEERIVRILGAVQDISRRVEEWESRHKLEVEIRRAELLKRLGLIAGGVAHDFNNMLVGILGRADLARRDLPESSPARTALDEIKSSATRAKELCMQLLAYAGKGKFVIKPLDLSELVREMEPTLRAPGASTITLRFALASGLPAVECDATQVRHIILNLVTNAREAIGDAEGTVTVSTGSSACDRGCLNAFRSAEPLEEGDYVFLEVKDTGCGFDSEKAHDFFEPFYTTKESGRGLGLSAVEGILRSHRGGIRIESVPGEGTTFRIQLPASGREVVPTPPASVADEWRGHGLILIVDDEEVVRDVGREMLGEIGFDVITASDGQEGVEAFRRRSDEIRAVLLDMTMPRMNGQAAFREIRRVRDDARVLICSGYSEEDSVAGFAGEGLAGFIQKPYDLEELRSALRQILE